MGVGVDLREKIAQRAAKEIKNGMAVNLGIGIPSLVPAHLPKDFQIMFHAENGVLGFGPSPEKGHEDENLCNASGYPITVMPGASYFDSTVSFGIIRKGLLDLTILGALEVSEKGDLANWIVPGKVVPGMGGAMELAQKSKRVIVVMNHTDKYGNPKIVKKCSLPITAKACVDLIITDKAVIRVTDEGLVLEEVLGEITIQEIINQTGSPLILGRSLTED